MNDASPEPRTLEDVARQVIAGEFGSGTERKEKLEAAGYVYDEVQAKVKELVAQKPRRKVK